MIFKWKKAEQKLAVLSAAPYIPAPGAASKKVLVADDDPVVLHALSSKLRSNGYNVLTATDASETINAVREQKPDCLLIDVNFSPEVGGVAWTGFSLAEWLKRTEYGRDLPVVVISANNRPDYHERAREAGAIAFLSKPIQGETLLSSVDTALRSTGSTQVPRETASVTKLEPMFSSASTKAAAESGGAGTVRLKIHSL